MLKYRNSAVPIGLITSFCPLDSRSICPVKVSIPVVHKTVPPPRLVEIAINIPTTESPSAASAIHCVDLEVFFFVHGPILALT